MGMNTRVGRRIVVTHCKCLVVMKNDKDVKRMEVDLYGDYSDITRATNACVKKLKSKRVLIESIQQDSFYASMPVETFVKNADQVSRTEKVKEKD